MKTLRPDTHPSAAYGKRTSSYYTRNDGNTHLTENLLIILSLRKHYNTFLRGQVMKMTRY